MIVLILFKIVLILYLFLGSEAYKNKVIKMVHLPLQIGIISLTLLFPLIKKKIRWTQLDWITVIF